jgi:hypothetical protein
MNEKAPRWPFAGLAAMALYFLSVPWVDMYAADAGYHELRTCYAKPWDWVSELSGPDKMLNAYYKWCWAHHAGTRSWRLSQS